MLTEEEKWNKIEAIKNKDSITSEDLDLLAELSNDSDVDIRYLVAEALCKFNNKDAEKILLKLLEDEDDLVRVNACDSLCVSTNADVIDILKKYAVDDKYFLVRGYAVLCITDICINIELLHDRNLNKFFKNSLMLENYIWVKIAYYRAIYLMGETQYLERIIKELNNKEYRIRCLVVNTLLDVASETNKPQIIDALSNRLKIEDPGCIAVVSSIKGAIRELKIKDS